MEQNYGQYGPSNDDGRQVDALAVFRWPARLPDGTVSHPTGTSMAAPVVANAVAKMLAVEPGLSVQEIRTLLLRTATPMEDQGPPLLHTRLAVRAAVGR